MYLAMTSYEESSVEVTFAPRPRKLCAWLNIVASIRGAICGRRRRIRTTMRASKQRAGSLCTIYSPRTRTFPALPGRPGSATDAKLLWARIFPDSPPPRRLIAHSSLPAGWRVCNVQGADTAATLQFRYTPRPGRGSPRAACAPLLDGEGHNDDAPALLQWEARPVVAPRPLNLRARMVERLFMRENVADLDTARR